MHRTSSESLSQSQQQGRLTRPSAEARRDSRNLRQDLWAASACYLLPSHWHALACWEAAAPQGQVTRVEIPFSSCSETSCFYPVHIICFLAHLRLLRSEHLWHRQQEKQKDKNFHKPRPNPATEHVKADTVYTAAAPSSGWKSPEQLPWKRFSVTKYPQYQGFYYCCGPMLAIHLFLCLCDVSFDCTMHTFCIIHAQPHLSHQQHQQHDACLPVRHPTDCLTENSISVWSI